MLKRFAILFFILTLAGHALGGVCGCFDLERKGRAAHSCCKKSRTKITNVKSKDCCDTDCSMSRGERPPHGKAADTAAVKLKTKVPVVDVAVRPIWDPVVAASTFTPPSPAAGHRLRHSRPPDLYLRHHSLLI
ncbi:MAG: hypothetical protein ACK4S4_00355 [Pyrinomonadaceae bacterium]